LSFCLGTWQQKYAKLKNTHKITCTVGHQISQMVKLLGLHSDSRYPRALPLNLPRGSVPNSIPQVRREQKFNIFFGEDTGKKYYPECNKHAIAKEKFFFFCAGAFPKTFSKCWMRHWSHVVLPILYQTSWRCLLTLVVHSRNLRRLLAKRTPHCDMQVTNQLLRTRTSLGR